MTLIALELFISRCRDKHFYAIQSIPAYFDSLESFQLELHQHVYTAKKYKLSKTHLASMISMLKKKEEIQKESHCKAMNKSNDF